MSKREPKRYKALYFDIRIKDLEQYYSFKNPKGAYRKATAVCQTGGCFFAFLSLY